MKFDEDPNRWVAQLQAYDDSKLDHVAVLPSYEAAYAQIAAWCRADYQEIRGELPGGATINDTDDDNTVISRWTTSLGGVRYRITERGQSDQAETEPFWHVHTHGAEDGPGLACNEIRLVNGRLLGTCQLPTESMLAHRTPGPLRVAAVEHQVDSYNDTVERAAKLIVDQLHGDSWDDAGPTAREDAQMIIRNLIAAGADFTGITTSV